MIKSTDNNLFKQYHKNGFMEKDIIKAFTINEINKEFKKNNGEIFRKGFHDLLKYIIENSL